MQFDAPAAAPPSKRQKVEDEKRVRRMVSCSACAWRGRKDRFQEHLNSKAAKLTNHVGATLDDAGLYEKGAYKNKGAAGDTESADAGIDDPVQGIQDGEFRAGNAVENADVGASQGGNEVENADVGAAQGGGAV